MKVVVALGDGVTTHAAGDAVYGTTPGKAVCSWAPLDSRNSLGTGLS